MQNLRTLSLAAAVASGLVAVAGETVLWPSPLTEMKAQQDSALAFAPSGAAQVKTGTKASWPGMRMDFKSGCMDLSAYGRLSVAVSNMTDKTRTVHLSVKGRTHQGQSPGGSITLQPRAAGVLTVDLRNMPWVLDAPLELNGMNGKPGVRGGSTFDLRETHSFHIFHNQDGIASQFSVSRVTVDGEGVPPKTLKASTFLPFVDKFGQFKHDDWPGKVHDEAELKVTREKEEDWLAAHPQSPIPECDQYGGWAGGPQLKATGFFRTEKVNGKWWLVDPEGRLFFSHGVDCVRVGGETGTGFRESYFEWIPEKSDPVFGRFVGKATWPGAHGFYKDPAHVPYATFSYAKANAVRKYGPDWWSLVQERAHARIKAWGLNTIANWSAPEIYRMDKTPYTATFGTRGPEIEGSTGWWGKLRDPFAQEFIDNARKSASAEAARTGTDPWCIGWFVDNELSWGHDNRDLARAVLRSPAKQPAKQAFRAALERKYGTAERLDAAWGTSYGSWDGFLASTNAVDEKKAGADLEDLHRSVVAQYFRVIRDAIKAAAPNRLYLGTRIAWGADVIYEESARYCDVVSVNIYNRRPARELPATAVDKPMINGEFHFGALDRGLFHTGLVGTRDQNERAQCYRDFVNACLDHPRFVGTHWFQWQDQALTGRSDGENYQIGFVTVTDTPYPELVQAARDIGSTMYRRRFGDPMPVAPTAKRELFNGKDLTNWYTFLKGRGRSVDPKGVFSVKDGVLHVTGEEFGCLTTEEAFKDYKLTVEYRWLGTSYGGKKKNAFDSGILFHSTGPDGGFGGIWMLSHEYNLITGASGDFWTVGRKDRPDIYLKAEVGTEKLGGKHHIHERGGKEVTLVGNDRVCRLDIARDWTDTPETRPAVNENPIGEWNTATLVCRGDTVECLFNGKLVNRATHVSPAGGRIQLQSELCGVEFRRVTIEPLPALLTPVTNAEIGVVADGALAFDDRAFSLTDDFARRLGGKTFFRRTIDGGFSAEVLRDGELFVVTPTAKSVALSQGRRLADMGFTKMSGEPFLAFGKNVCDIADIWRKNAKKGERIVLEKWAIVCGFDDSNQWTISPEERAQQARILESLRGTPSEKEDPRGILVNRPDYVVFVPKQPRDKSKRDPAKPGDTYNDHFQVISNPSNGMLYAFWTQASREADIDQHIAFSRSADKGLTWTDPVVLAGSPNKRNPALLASWQQPMLAKSGRLYCLWNQQTTSRGPHCGLMFGAYSDNDGETWSAPKLVPFTERMDADPADDHIPPSWCNWQRPLRLGENDKFFVGCSRHGKASYDERFGCKIEFWEFQNIDDNPLVQDIKLKYFSTNRSALSAKNLEKTGGFRASEPALEEAAPVKLPDGRLFAIMRSSVGSPVWVQSRDGGRSWSEPKILKDAEGKPYLHPRSPCPMYDWKGPEAASGKYFALVHQTFDFNEPKRNAYQRRGPLYLIAGEFDPKGEQPVKFKAPKLFAPRKNGNSFYTSYCVVDGKGVLWYNDMKFYLCGRVVGPEWFE